MKLFIKKLYILLSISCILPSQVHAAETISNLYEARVPLADRSLEARNSALSDGLEQVLVRYSGYSGIATLSGVAEALSSANRYAIEFSVETGAIAAEDGLATEKDEFLWVRYNAAQVDQLFERYQLPVWPSVRSDVRYVMLREVWDQRMQLDEQSYPAMAVSLDATFEARGLAAESYSTRLFSASEMWNLSDVEAFQLRNESEADILMIVKAVQDDILGAYAEVMIVDESEVSVSRQRNMEAIPGAQHILNEFVDLYSSNFAFLGGSSQQEDVFLSVSGVRDFSQYKRILSVISDIDQVSSARLERLRGDEMLFRVNYGADHQRLLSAIVNQTSLERGVGRRSSLGTVSDPLVLFYEQYSESQPINTNVTPIDASILR